MRLFIKLLLEHYVALIFSLMLLIDVAITFAILFLLSLLPDYPKWVQNDNVVMLICVSLIVLVVPIVYYATYILTKKDFRAHPKWMIAYANGNYAYSSILRDCMNDYTTPSSVLYAFEWRVGRIQCNFKF